MNSLSLVFGLVALTALAVWAWPASVIEAQEQQLVVEGQVINGTSGASGVAGLIVVLHEATLTAHIDIDTITDDAGNFRFDAVTLDPMASYGVSVNYQGALYGMDVDSSAGSPMSLMIYDTTESEDFITATAASVLFASVNKSTQTISALEIIKIVNGSDRTYVPGTNPMNLLRFGLPPGTRGLQVDTALLEADYAQVDRGFALLASVPPGEHEVMFSYEFPYSGNETTFTKSFRYGAESLRILAPGGELKLSGDQVGAMENVMIGGRSYQLIQATNLSKGTEISLKLTGLPEQSLIEGLNQQIKVVRFEYTIPVAFGLLLLAVIGYVLMKKAKEERGVFVTSSDESISYQEQQTIRQMIADLELGFRGGSMNEDDYRRRRKVLELRLASLVRG
ncbi:MAG: hypothetical protein IIC84_05915 [Chloroflexi bacterium]|nr:hypothetical protein [Chloroflexota bacterium]